MIDPTKLNKPEEYILTRRLINLEPNQFKYNYLYVSNLEFSSDESIFINDPKNTTLSYVDSIKNTEQIIQDKA